MLASAVDVKGRVLIADDQRDVQVALRMLLTGEGFEVTTVSSPGDALSRAKEADFDAALIDLNYTRDTTSGDEGFELVEALRALDETLPVIVMTAWSTVEGAVRAMQLGARDYVQKPWDNAKLVATVNAHVGLRRALRRSQRLSDQARRAQAQSLPQVIGESVAMREVLELIERVAPSDANLLITGEHGTGKEVAARWVVARSKRADRPLVTVNMGGVAEGTFESELFGHVRGAFTDAKEQRAGCFELADGGTLFMDEIGNLPLNHQAKLLRVLQSRELQRVGSSKVVGVDVRVIAATNVDLYAEVTAGKFREDLLYRLNTVEIRLPALRQRAGDILPLAKHFLAAQCRRYDKALDGFDADAERALLAHAWPGNVRELEHTIERAVLLARGDRVAASDLSLRQGGKARHGAASLEELTLEEAEKHLIVRALDKTDGNVGKAAERLGVSRSALYRRLEKFGLSGSDK